MRGFDLSNKSSATALSKAGGVIKELLECGNVTEQAVAAMTDYAERDRVFERCYLALFHRLYPMASNEDFDRRRIGDLTYMSVYDLLHPKVNPSSKRRRTGNNPA